MAIRSEDAAAHKPGRQDNMTKERAERLGLRVGTRIRHYRVIVRQDKKGVEVKSREGTALALWKHGFVVQLPHWKEFFRYNLLRGQESGERVEIVGTKNHES